MFYTDEFDCNNLQKQLPFDSLSGREFNSLFNCTTRQLDADKDLYIILPNQNKLDENDPDNMLTNLVSGPKAFPVFHCNVRSLPKTLLYYTR